MKPVTSGLLSDLPTGERPDPDRYPYGLEPLVLPPAGYLDVVRDDPAPGAHAGAHADAHADACRRLRALGERGVPVRGAGRGAAGDAGDAADERFWFRWITGHQVCFVVWRLIARLLDDVNHGRCAPDDALDPVRRLVDGYSAMLLYTGSCPRDVYTVLIRPSMRLRHQAFSGTWAPDYWPIRELFRARGPAPLWAADTGELMDAVTLHNLVHTGVAARLVADGRSLLRQASVRNPDRRTAEMIFDTYFMTVRAPATGHAVVGQLLDRLVAVAQDVAVHGLYAAHDDERPAELQAVEVLESEHRLVDIMVEVARCACELVPAERRRPALRGTVSEE